MSLISDIYKNTVTQEECQLNRTLRQISFPQRLCLFGLCTQSKYMFNRKSGPSCICFLSQMSCRDAREDDCGLEWDVSRKITLLRCKKRKPKDQAYSLTGSIYCTCAMITTSGTEVTQQHSDTLIWSQLFLPLQNHDPKHKPQGHKNVKCDSKYDFNSPYKAFNI